MAFVSMDEISRPLAEAKAAESDRRSTKKQGGF